ncbi:MAG: metallophosphoesterase [Janthinobacterium lividum]
MPLRPLSFLTALLHVYIGLRLGPAIYAANPVAAVVVLLVLATSATTIPLPFVGLWSRHEPLSRVWQWIGLLAMGWFSSMLVLTLLRDAGLMLTWLAQAAAGLAVDWPHVRQWSAFAVPLMATASSAIGLFNARRTAPVKRVDVPIQGLPTAFDGFTIAQLSDLHVGPTIRRGYIQRIVDRVNRLEPDAIAITGDLVDGTVAALRSHIAPLADLKAHHGVFAVTGNHEYYAGAHAWIAEMRRLGMRVLMNEHVLIGATGAGAAQNDEEIDDATLVLAGVTDFNAAHFDAAHASNPTAALAGAPSGATTRVLLAHQPRSAPEAAAAGFQLQLSGHTHGGQFFPWNLAVPLQQPFTAGLNRLGGMWVYTSRGTGYWGPPKRFGAPSEITLLRLVVAQTRTSNADRQAS